jgi:hypothetical protein
MSARAAWALGLAALALGACNGGDGDPAQKPPPERRSAASGGGPSITVRPRRGEPEEAGSIRSWSAAVNRGDYRAAAAFFAKDAIVQQTERFRLPGRAAAIAFNRGLPCRADVTDVDDEGHTILAAFRLRAGPGGRCTGAARVRFSFRGARFTRWLQLPEPEEPPGQVV